MAEVLVFLPPHGVLAPVCFFGERAARLLEAHIVMLGEPLNVPFVERDQWVGATVPGAIATIVHAFRSAPVFNAEARPDGGPTSLTSRAAASFEVQRPLVNAFRTPVPGPTAAARRGTRPYTPT